MADETTQTPELDGAATPNRDRRHEPPVIEGEMVGPRGKPDAPPAGATDVGAQASQSPVAEPAVAEPPPAPPPARPARPILSAGIGAVVGAAFAAGGLWYVSQRSAVDADLAARLDRIEKSPPASSVALVALDKRVGALEAALARGPDKTIGDAYGQRITALESAALSAKAAADANEGSLAEAQAARADAAKALALAASAAQGANGAPAAQAGPSEQANALEGRIGKLEAGLAALDRPPVDLAPVNQRIDKLESVLAAPKSETRAPAESVAPSRDWAALAVVAQALGDRLRAGAPFAPEQAALERLGADPARLTALKPLAEKGAPTTTALASDFARIAPSLLAAGPTKSGGAIDRLFANMSKVVRVTPVGEIAGDDPAALVSQIGAALERGRLGPALAVWERLPEAARQASQEWAGEAQARLAADQAAQGVVDDAIAGLAPTSH
jgi:hypothetical protein